MKPKQGEPLLLVVDTTGPAVAVGLDDGLRLRRASRRIATKPDQYLWPLLERLLNRSDRTLAEIEWVAAARGPGRFTGVRIGLAFATMLARSLGCPMVGPTLLETLAHAAADVLPKGSRLAALAPAVRGELFVQMFKVGRKEARPEGPPRWTPPEGLAKIVTGPVWLAGEPAAAAAARLPKAKVLRAQGPTLKELAACARTLPGAASLAPLYLKPANYELPRGK